MLTGVAIFASGLGLGVVGGAAAGFIFTTMIFTINDEKDEKQAS